MSHGLEVQNSGGDLVIDAAFANFEIVAEGSGTHNGTGLTAYVDVSFPPTAQPPLVFVRSTSYGLACATLIKNGSGLYASARLYSSAPYNTFAFDWFVAAPAGSSASSDTWGMRVYDAGGDVVFDSGRRYVQFRDVVEIDLTAIGPGDFDVDGNFAVTHASIADAYYCLPALRALIAGDGVEGVFTHFPAARAYSATTAYISYAGQSFTGYWTPDPYTIHPVYLVVATKSN